VLAELVAWRHDRGPLGELPVEAVDPVCGMTVAVGADTPSAEHEGTTYFFCCPGCRGRFARNPEKYLASA
jgi:xanthine dehydrogenase accessory factor